MGWRMNKMIKETMKYHKKIDIVLENISKVMIGKQDETVLSLVALLAQGHVLFEDVPGVGKTMLVRALAKSLDCDFRRIQFTPDLLPSDITGISIYNPKEMEFEYRPGPLLGNVVLADEINRSSPKTQSSLLEGMEEKRVTVDGNTVLLQRPFFVMATQNPVEFEGTYPLPEAQLDRFLLKLKLGYPTLEEELEMLERTTKNHPIESVQSVISKAELITLQEEVKEIYIDQSIQWYILKLVSSTRNHHAIHFGASPRASIALMKASQAFAFVKGRDYVLPDDVKYLTPFVLSQRITLTHEATYDGVDREQTIVSIIKNTNIPIRRKFSG